MVGVIIGTQYIPCLDQPNIDLIFFVPIISPNLCLFTIAKSFFCFASFLLFGRGAPLPSSSWSFHQNESSGREQIESLLYIALNRLFNYGVRIGMKKCTSTIAIDATGCNVSMATCILNVIREFKYPRKLPRCLGP